MTIKFPAAIYSKISSEVTTQISASLSSELLTHSFSVIKVYSVLSLFAIVTDNSPVVGNINRVVVPDMSHVFIHQFFRVNSVIHITTRKWCNETRTTHFKVIFKRLPTILRGPWYLFLLEIWQPSQDRLCQRFKKDLTSSVACHMCGRLSLASESFGHAEFFLLNFFYLPITPYKSWKFH